MASRADRTGAPVREPPRATTPATERARTPPIPRLGVVLRASLSDYYFNSLRLVAVNTVWGMAVVLVVALAFIWPLGALLLAPLLVFPTAIVFRTAGRIVRGQSPFGTSDLVRSSGQDAGAMLALGFGVVLVVAVLASNLMTGLLAGDAPGLVLATLAGWGLGALWCALLILWPLLADPVRRNDPLRGRLALTGGLLLAEPVRVLGLAVLAIALTMISVALTVAILTVSLSFIALVACRAVYPAADRLEPAMGGLRP